MKFKINIFGKRRKQEAQDTQSNSQEEKIETIKESPLESSIVLSTEKTENNSTIKSELKEEGKKKKTKNKKNKKTSELEQEKVIPDIQENKTQEPEKTDEIPEENKTHEESKKQKHFLKSKFFSLKSTKKDVNPNKVKKEKSSREKTEEEKEAQEKIRLRRAFNQKAKKEKRRVAKILSEYLEKSGHEIRGEEYNKKVQHASIFIAIITSVTLSIIFAAIASRLHVFLFFLIFTFGLCFAVSYLLIMAGSFIFLDYQVYRRTKEIEEVLPEFLQLASANISAGMPIDRALWFAVRPKFGVLAKEIEEVAKATMAGEDLEQALETFTNKYDSKILKESINLLIEGMRAGGEIGFLLNQIASNMQDIKIMRKEIAASVMSYVIFITAASIIGAPFLLALSSQLLVIMGQISSNVQLDDSATAGSSFKIDMSADSININDFKIFAVVVLLFSSVFSAMIISVIRKGNTNESFKIIPGYIFVSLLIFFAASALFGGLLGGFF